MSLKRSSKCELHRIFPTISRVRSSAYLGKMNRIFWILYVFIICKACAPVTEKAEIRVFVAASLSPAVTEMASVFEEEKGVHVLVNTASSGTLARQIAQGASADIFISAHQQWMSFLRDEKLLKGEQTLPAKNQLVLIVPANSMIKSVNLSNTDQWNDLLSKVKLAMGDPQHVPVGQYARQAMETLNWRPVPQQTLQTKDARSTLVAVEFGEADLGIVYKTDAEKSEKVKIIANIPTETYGPINYFAGICSDNTITSDFLNFLNSPEAIGVWKTHGFTFSNH